MRKVQSILTSTISVLFLLTLCGFSQAAFVEKEAVEHVKKNGPGFIRDKYEKMQYFWEQDQTTGKFLKMSADGMTYSEYCRHGVLQARYENGVCTSKSGSIYQEHGMERIKVGTSGTEDRRHLTAAEKQIPAYKRVGIVVGPSGEEGTGMVYGKNCEYVLTAAHVTWENEGEGSQNRLIKKNTSGFLFSDDPSGNGRISNGTVVYSGWPSKTQKDRRDDFAIIKLNPPAYRKSQCKRLGKLIVKKWEPNNPKKVNCDGKLSMVAMNTEDPSNLRIDDEFYGQEPGTRGFKRESETFQTDGDSNNMSSGAPTWCHENNSIKLVGIIANQMGYNPKGYNIDQSVGTNPGFGEYDKETRFSYHISVWSKMESLLSQYGGGSNSIGFEK